MMYEWIVPASYRMDAFKPDHFKLWHGCYSREEYFGVFVEFDSIRFELPTLTDFGVLEIR